MVKDGRLCQKAGLPLIDNDRKSGVFYGIHFIANSFSFLFGCTLLDGGYLKFLVYNSSDRSSTKGGNYLM
jgi:hypothetical protein